MPAKIIVHSNSCASFQMLTIPENRRLENWTSAALITGGDENEPKAGLADKSKLTEPRDPGVPETGRQQRARA